MKQWLIKIPPLQLNLLSTKKSDCEHDMNYKKRINNHCHHSNHNIEVIQS